MDKKTADGHHQNQNDESDDSDGEDMVGVDELYIKRYMLKHKPQKNGQFN